MIFFAQKLHLSPLDSTNEIYFILLIGFVSCDWNKITTERMRSCFLLHITGLA